MFYIDENKIREYSKKKKLPVVYEKCPCLLDSYRKEVRQFTNSLNVKEKENIMKNFDKIFPLIQKLKVENKLNYCKICGEPSRNEICKMCRIFEGRKDVILNK